MQGLTRVAEGFTLSFQLFTYVVTRGGAGALRGSAGTIVIIIAIPRNHVIRLRLIDVEADLAHCLVLHILQSKQTLLKPAG
jgi:hypothetical protein